MRSRVLSAQNPPTRLLLQKRKIRRAMLGILPDFAVEYPVAELMFYLPKRHRFDPQVTVLIRRPF